MLVYSYYNIDKQNYHKGRTFKYLVLERMGFNRSPCNSKQITQGGQLRKITRENNYVRSRFVAYTVWRGCHLPSGHVPVGYTLLYDQHDNNLCYYTHNLL